VSVGGRESRIAEGLTRPSLVDGAEQAVRDWLAPGRFREGDRLPTEEQLAEMLGISRGTLRSALRRLEVTGEIVRRQGSGTFVGSPPEGPGRAVPWLRADSYTARPRAGTVSVIRMTVERAPLDDRAADWFTVDRERPAVQIRRVLASSGVPFAITHDVLHPDLAPADEQTVHDQLRRGGTVHALVLALTGIAFSLRRTRIESLIVEPTDPVGRMLELTERAACVRTEEKSVGDGRPIHYASDVLAPWRVEIEVVQSASPTRPAPVSDRGV
jgi:DNA-binding GntR family transcriptional regulator